MASILLVMIVNYAKSLIKPIIIENKKVKFGIKRDHTSLFFETNDKGWFNSLFVNANDGIAIDIVSKDCCACAIDIIEKVQIKGQLLAPVYSKRFKGGLKKSDNSLYRVLV
mgnify:CR=1 FL=1